MSYAAVLLVISSAILLLLFAGLESFGAAPNLDFEDVAYHPVFVLGVLGVGALIAPRVSRRIPVAGEPVEKPADGKPRMRYEVRIILFVLLGMTLSIVASLLVVAFG
jgi:hypothetical protein